MDKKGKLQLKERFAIDLSKSSALIIAEYRGLTVEEVTALRVELRKCKSEFKVMKNRILKKAIDQDVPDLECVKSKLTGPVGVVCVYGDSALATKTALEFEKNHPNFVVTGGYIDKTGLGVHQLKQIADLPSKEELLARIVGTMVSPQRGLVTVLSGVSRQLVQVINAIKEKKA